MMMALKLNGLQLDPVKLRIFKDFINYTLDKNKPLNYKEFSQNCGISRIQWEQFRELNVENKLNWSVE